MTHQAILDPRQAGTDDQRSATLCFASKVLKWLVKLLIKAGVSCDEFNQLARWHYVNEFYSDPELWQPRRKPFKSKAAVLCGLPRKEVMRLRGMSAPGVITEKINRVWRVLGGWTTDPRYLDKSGLPKPLPFASNRGADFRQLAKECNTDVPARTLLDELLRADCVEELDDGKYTVKKKGYIPHALPAELIDTTANAAEFLLSTIVHNVHNPGAGAYLQREWHFQYVPVEAIPEVRALIEPETIRHGREMDKIMSEFAHKRPLKNKEYKQVGLGAYYFQI